MLKSLSGSCPQLPLLIPIILILSLLQKVSPFLSPSPSATLPIQSLFSSWLQSHSIPTPSAQQYPYRLYIFQQNYQQIVQHNQLWKNGQVSYRIGLNAFSHLGDWEFREKFIGNLYGNSNGQSNYQCAGEKPVVKDLPEAFDWVTKGAISGVRNLGSCGGGGYAVSAAQTIQSGRFITTGNLLILSVSQILDCSTQTGNKQCGSGNILNSFQYIQKSGITSQSLYPFSASNRSCSYKISQKEWQILGCTKLSQNETLLRSALYRQPLSAAINATLSKFKSYSDGIFQGGTFGCKASNSHWVTMVGWGTDVQSKKKYWKVKNSWGTEWGMQGYVLILRNGDGEGTCGVQNEVYSPID